MKNSIALSNVEVRQFRADYLKFQERGNQLLLSKLKDFQLKQLSNLSVLTEYHDLLLFCAAYPVSEEIRSLVIKELERIHSTVLEIYLSTSIKKKITLSGSGIAGSSLTGSFSFELVGWLNKEFPGSVKFEGFGESEVAPAEILRLGLMPAETELSEKKDLSFTKWIALACGSGKHHLKNVLGIFESMKLPQEIRDYLYDTLKLYIDFDCRESRASRTFGHITGTKIVYHRDELIKKPDPEFFLKEKIPAKLFLSTEEKQEYVDAARIALFTLFRETDPVTFAEVEATEVYDTGRGLTIALYYLRSDRRLALDAYVGYVAFKNGIPCAYGGGWIFRSKSKIGINIFPPYRGGESAWIFLQIMRLYRHRFNVNFLEAEPYQIGKNNPEGIQSGAFWFYYRLGFRPVQDDLFELAGKEWEKIITKKKYRTPAAVLRILANSNLRLDTNQPGTKSEIMSADAQGLGAFVTSFIIERFQGNRKNAAEYFQKNIYRVCPGAKTIAKTSSQKRSLNLLLPLAFLLVTQTDVLKENMELFLKWLISKSEESEIQYIQYTQKLDKYFEVLEKIRKR